MERLPCSFETVLGKRPGEWSRDVVYDGGGQLGGELVRQTRNGEVVHTVYKMVSLSIER